jgi:hypothetical protein
MTHASPLWLLVREREITQAVKTTFIKGKKATLVPSNVKLLYQQTKKGPVRAT